MKPSRLSATTVYLIVTIVAAMLLFFVVSIWALAIIGEGGVNDESGSKKSAIR